MFCKFAVAVWFAMVAVVVGNDIQDISIIQLVVIPLTGNCSGNACVGDACTGAGCSGIGCTGKGCTGKGCTGKGCTGRGVYGRLLFGQRMFRGRVHRCRVLYRRMHWCRLHGCCHQTIDVATGNNVARCRRTPFVRILDTNRTQCADHRE